MPGQSWNAAAFLMAQQAVATGETPFGGRPRRGRQAGRTATSGAR
jgi:hypothetical protein